MALNYTPPPKITETLWIHRLEGCDFLVRGPRDKLVKLAEAIVGEHGDYTEDGQFTCSSPELKTAIHEDGFEPHKNFYDTIAYVERNEAYCMVMSDTEPEEYFKELKMSFEGCEYPYEFVWPVGFKMVEREAPYDFTRKMLSPEEIDSNLMEYNSRYFCIEDETDEDICMFCHNPMDCCPEEGDHSTEMREIIRRIRHKDKE
jgi:hypothetical protein